MLEHCDPRKRFTRLVPDRPYCTDNPKSGVYINSRAAALRRAYLQPNTPWRLCYISLDIDRQGAAFAAEAAGLPYPTLIVINPETAHSHYLYELAAPVLRDRSAKLDWLADAVTGGLGRMLDSDPAYNGLLVQNPLHPRWRTLVTNSRFDLDSLASEISPDLLKPRRACNQRFLYASSRNCQLFDVVRPMAYRQAKWRRSKEELYQDVLALCEAYNIFQPPLLASEVRSTARSITKFSWRHRETIGHHKRRGVMGLGPINPNTGLAATVRQRQILGAGYAREQRSDRIDNDLRKALEVLRKDSSQIRISELVREAKVSRSTIYRRLHRNGRSILS